MDKIISSANKYDKFLFLLILGLGLGAIGGALQIPRVLAILFIPSLMKVNVSTAYISRIRTFFIIWMLWIVLSLLWTPDKSEGMKFSMYYMVHFIYFLEICIFSTVAKNPFESISSGWVYAILISSVVGYWELITDQHTYISKLEGGQVRNLGGGLIVSQKFAASFFMNYNSYVTFLCTGLPFVFYKLMNTRGFNLKNLPQIIALVSAAVFILYNASRGGALALAIMFLGYVIATRKAGTGKLSFIMIVTVGAVIFMKFGSDMLAGITSRLSAEGTFTEDSRWIIWLNALRVFADTLGLGTGVGGIMTSMTSVSNDILITHNFLLEVLVEFGLLIFVYFIILLFRLVKTTIKMPSSLAKNVLVIALLAFPFYSIVDSSYCESPFTFALLSSLAVFAYEYR